jgi:hypothetical protein
MLFFEIGFLLCFRPGRPLDKDRGFVDLHSGVGWINRKQLLCLQFGFSGCGGHGRPSIPERRGCFIPRRTGLKLDDEPCSSQIGSLELGSNIDNSGDGNTDLPGESPSKSRSRLRLMDGRWNNGLEVGTLLEE